MAKTRRGRRKREGNDPFGALPRYHQAYIVIAERIRRSVYPLGKPLPTELELAGEFGVSRVTIRRALAQVEREGLIRRVRGRGTYPLGTPDPGRTDIGGLFENLATLGRDTRVRLLRYDRVTTPAGLLVREAGFGPDALLVTRVRSLGGEPFAYLTSYLPARCARHVRRERLGNSPLLTILERAGITPVAAEQVLSARAADATVARALAVPVGSPLIHMTRLSRDGEGRPIEYFESDYRPDRFEYQMTLSRVRTGGAPKWVPAG